MNLPLARTGILVLLALAGCGGGGGSPGGITNFGQGSPAAPPVAPRPTTGPLQIRVSDVTGLPISGAVVTVSTTGMDYQSTSGVDGNTDFRDIPKNGEAVTITVGAAGYEAASVTSVIDRETRLWAWHLSAEGAWAIGRPVVLGTHMVERSNDGGAMTFTVDVAVLDENSESLETLTSADFTIYQIDCGWGGSRDCASDAMGNATGSDGIYQTDGVAQAFGLQPPSNRHPYLVDVLVERSSAIADWDQRAPALKSFFAALGGNDVASLASVQATDGNTTHTVLGPFTSDGATYFDAIDTLADPAGEPPAVLDGLLESISSAAAASEGDPAAERTVLVLATSDMFFPDFTTATALALQSGIHISAIGSTWGAYGFTEVAARTGGFVANFEDSRQLGLIFGGMDQLLAGTTSFYRMQFRITGSPQTFVSGGNVKIYLKIDVPTPLPNNGMRTEFDVAIP